MTSYIPSGRYEHHFHFPSRWITLLKLNRLLQVYRPFKYISKRQKSVKTNSNLMRALKYVMVGTLTYYWLCCWTVAMNCFGRDCKEFIWMRAHPENLKRMIKNRGQLNSYMVTTFSYCASIFFSAGTSIDYARTNSDFVWSGITVITGNNSF